MNLSKRKKVGHLTRPLFPSFSTCGRCDRPWAVCEGHDTPYTENRDCFPLCGECWVEITPEERLPYYIDLAINQWQDTDTDTLTKIIIAVMKGK